MTITGDEFAHEVEKMLTPELQALAKMIEERIPKGWGFGCLIFEFSREKGRPMLWVSNAQREDMIDVMREYVEKRGGQ